jgi:hypothetical protein
MKSDIFYRDNGKPPFRCAGFILLKHSIYVLVQEFQGIGMEDFEELYDDLSVSRLRY